MAKQRTITRPEKRVLTRQAVERTGRRFTPSKGVAAAKAPPASSAGGSALRDILAVFAFIGSIGLFCALWTFRREDALAARVENLIGPVGHRAASGLFGLAGVCAYLIPVALFYSSLALFVRGRGRHRGRQIAGMIALAVFCAVLAHLLVGNTHVLAYPPGGAIGAALGETLRGTVSTLGSILLMMAAAGGALIVATDGAFARACVAAGRWTGRFAVASWAFSLAEGKKQYASWLTRREQRRLEKAEEDAAFAQALADAEESEAQEMDMAELDPELAEETRRAEPAFEMEPPAEELPEQIPLHAPTEDESLAAEADEVAEEAARLARQAEDRRAQEQAEQKARDAALRAARRARNAPLEDPAWTMAPPADAAVTESTTLPTPVEAKQEERPRPQPIINLPALAQPGAEARVNG
ncbi:MAG: DNA translocase FtsK 4TM domain-containing protein [Deltaproteobacteria bacterium]|nr:DNA translocase FtsK 4TM domain-containing protein [Deltaproteobacteria bacterium]